MDISEAYQVKNKSSWWMDIILYFCVSLLLASVACYVIFLVENDSQRKNIQKESANSIASVSAQQKNYESTVVSYQKKINDFNSLFLNHEFASNVFAFMEAQTLPNIWFKQFDLDEKNSTVQLSGEADNMAAFSQQISVLEKNKYVKSMGNLSSSAEKSAKVAFSLNLTLDPSIFDYVSAPSLVIPSSQPATQQTEANNTNTVANAPVLPQK